MHALACLVCGLVCEIVTVVVLYPIGYSTATCHTCQVM